MTRDVMAGRQTCLSQALVWRFEIALTYCYPETIPLLVRRGGCAVNKKSQSHLIPRRRGGRSQAMVQQRIPQHGL